MRYAAAECLPLSTACCGGPGGVRNRLLCVVRCAELERMLYFFLLAIPPARKWWCVCGCLLLYSPCPFAWLTPLTTHRLFGGLSVVSNFLVYCFFVSATSYLLRLLASRGGGGGGAAAAK